MCELKTVRIDRKRWILPKVLPFGKGSHGPHFFYDVVGFRAPQQGEFFISGAIPQAYQTRHNLSSSYLIAVPTTKARRVQKWEPVE